jgi:hypothetical protein
MEHREIAAQTYNATWDLLEADRTPAQDLELLGVAFASRYHWGFAGGAKEKAIADWMASRCLAAVGEGSLAVRFADSALQQVPTEQHWLVASMHEGRARAAQAAGDESAKSEHVAKAQAALAKETDDEDRAAIAAQLADLL